LRSVTDINVLPTGSFTWSLDDNSNNAHDWSSLAALVDYCSVCAMKFKFIPTATADTSFDYAQGYIFDDVNTPTLAAGSIEIAIQCENCKMLICSGLGSL
jgi:hypothetical protein